MHFEVWIYFNLLNSQTELAYLTKSISHWIKYL